MTRKKRSLLPVCGIAAGCIVVMLAGCARPPAQTAAAVPAPLPQEAAVQKQAVAAAPEIRPAPAPPAPCDPPVAEKQRKDAAETGVSRALPAVYVVRHGDSLWWIAKYRDIYNDPYLWPVLHDANRRIIRDPGRIYPGMTLQIPRSGFKPAEIRNARKAAGAPRPYTPPARAVPPAD